MLAGDHVLPDEIFLAVDHDGLVRCPLREGAGDGSDVVAEVLEHRIGHDPGAAIRHDASDLHQALRLVHRQRAQHHGVDQT